jgi:glyoxylase-like metal-dependent hydrolase (beta-lactamase superfamily II)
MIHEQVVVGPFQCNCSLLACETTREAIVVDPGGEGELILEILKQKGWVVKYLVHTHAHLDHVGATEPVHAATRGKICLHRDDLFLYENVAMQAALFGLPAFTVPDVEYFIEDKDILKFGKYRAEILHTPGHTPGSVTYLVDTEQGVELFTGDTLFMGSIGRTDLWGGDSQQILRSIQDKLLPLDDGTRVHPGHGPHSTIGAERRRNPFLQGLD